MDEPYRFVVHRRRLAETGCIADPDAPDARPLAEGEARLRIEQFALTANNITYAAFGDAMQYWAFFDAGDPEHGCVPVWGFAEVVQSRCPGVEPGTRVYGYLPMGSFLVVRPGRVRERGFVDMAPHRAGLPAAYNDYLDVAHDPMHRPGREALQALLRPLFTTSFLLADHLAEHANFGARRLLLSSASSKTAYATAFCAARLEAPPCTGLTARGNLDFVRSLACYDRTAPYDDPDALGPKTPTVYIDFSGDAALRARVHTHLGDALLRDVAVGGSHWQALRPGSAAALPGPRPVLFFAPEQARRRAAEPPQGMGRQALDQALTGAWQAFVERVTGAEPPWLVERTLRGPKALQDTFAALRDGRVGPRDGLLFIPR